MAALCMVERPETVLRLKLCLCIQSPGSFYVYDYFYITTNVTNN